MRNFTSAIMAARQRATSRNGMGACGDMIFPDIPECEGRFMVDNLRGDPGSMSPLSLPIYFEARD